MKKMNMKITRHEEIEGDGWNKRTSTVSELSDEYIRNAMGIDPDGKPLDMIIGEFRKYLVSIYGKDDDFGLGVIDPMTDFEIGHAQCCISDHIVYYKVPRGRIEFKWTIVGA